MIARSILITLLAISAGTTCVHAQQGKSTRKAPPKQRSSLFFGGDSNNSGMAKSEFLPTAAQIEALAGRLSARQRNLDAFGLATFPREDDQPIPDDDFMRMSVRVTLNQALQTLKINGVNLRDKHFLIGGRNACEGDVVVLTYKSELFQAQVVEVSATQILFRDLQRQETGVLQHSAVPHLEMEPLQNVATRFEARMAPMEPPTPPKR